VWLTSAPTDGLRVIVAVAFTLLASKVADPAIVVGFTVEVMTALAVADAVAVSVVSEGEAELPPPPQALNASAASAVAATRDLRTGYSLSGPSPMGCQVR
ncbi:MAG: hypothetical protein EBS41_03875, partial [Actinobacteria bacterium]|nr:hypothetical protein [Actinomycetota bacterium]